MISIHHEKQIIGTGQENSKPFRLFNPKWTLRKCIIITEHIFTIQMKPQSTKIRYDIKILNQICKVNSLLLQSLHVNITVTYFWLSGRSDTCSGWVWALTLVGENKRKANNTKHHPEYTYLFPDLSKWASDNTFNGLLRLWITRILLSVVTHGFKLQILFSCMQVKTALELILFNAIL